MQTDGYVGFAETFSGGKFSGYDFIEENFGDAWGDIDEAFVGLHMIQNITGASPFPYKVTSLDISELQSSLADTPLPIRLEFFKFIPERSQVHVQYILESGVRKEESPKNILCKNTIQESERNIYMTCTVIVPADRLTHTVMINFWYE